ncbi:PRC-barrel domain-containing protein [uncultured Thiohalocapsa sp.]|uniref:PRC-barrel domain-containing protein n=1 Tax=uncultured Thiohalocapsa sp. TaxID=768990 RepID=UPI0025F484E8|nr:PRC-barrel domain-containing protein [uncultured Thiohalocapsa sp.]
MFKPNRFRQLTPRMSVIAMTLALGGTCLVAGPVAAETDAGDMSRQQSGAMGAPTQPQQGSMAGQGQQRMGTAQGQASGSGKSIAKQLPDRYKLSTWMGKEVQNRQGEKLGTVKELVMDDLGRVRYVVMQSDLLAGSKRGDMVTVPVGHFVYPLARKDSLVFDTTPAKVQNAPAFGRTSATPNMGRQDVSSVIIAYWLPEDQKQRMAAEQQGQQKGQRQAGTDSDQQGGMTDYDIDQYEPNRDVVNLSQRKGAMFEELDQNDNDVIDRQEAQGHAQLSKRFDEVDTYGNQAITRSEFAAFEIDEDSSDMGRSGRKRQGDSMGQ